MPSLALDPLVPVAPTGLERLAARDIARLVARGELSAEQVTLAHLRRIEACDRWLRSLISIDAERALYTARRIDHARRAGRPLGPLAGVPVVVKDNLDVRGQPTSCCSRAHGGVIASRHAAVVSRILADDGVLLGRANMDEMALGASTQTSAFGPTHNPWDLRRSPGGSSGGSAAAVAAGLAALALGSDTGGSIREPAAQCGVVGMAPSPGLVPADGLVPFSPMFDRVGPLARTCADTALLLATLSGRSNLIATSGRRLGPRRVGVVDELCGPRNQPGVLARFDATLAALVGCGIELVPVSVPDSPNALDAYSVLTSAAGARTLAAAVGTGRAGREVVRRYELGRALLSDSDGALAFAHAVHQRLIEQTGHALARCDVLISPTLPTTAPFLNNGDAVTAQQLADPMSTPYTDCWTVVASLAGIPSLSLPAGRSPDDGMPVGIMMSAAAGADGLLLALGEALERTGLDDAQ